MRFQWLSIDCHDVSMDFNGLSCFFMDVSWRFNDALVVFKWKLMLVSGYGCHSTELMMDLCGTWSAKTVSVSCILQSVMVAESLVPYMEVKPEMGGTPSHHPFHWDFPLETNFGDPPWLWKPSRCLIFVIHPTCWITLTKLKSTFTIIPVTSLASVLVLHPNPMGLGHIQFPDKFYLRTSAINGKPEPGNIGKSTNSYWRSKWKAIGQLVPATKSWIVLCRFGSLNKDI